MSVSKWRPHTYVRLSSLQCNLRSLRLWLQSRGYCYSSRQTGLVSTPYNTSSSIGLSCLSLCWSMAESKLAALEKQIWQTAVNFALDQSALRTYRFAISIDKCKRRKLAPQTMFNWETKGQSDSILHSKLIMWSAKADRRYHPPCFRQMMHQMGSWPHKNSKPFVSSANLLAGYLLLVFRNHVPT